MEKEAVGVRNHVINVVDRKNTTISGVKKVISFDDQEFVLETVMGFVLIKGEGLEIIKLETFQGDLQMKGTVNSIDYLENKKDKKKEESFITKLFK